MGEPQAETPAGLVVHQEIRARGPISFARFMELALYDPLHGYYSRAGAGPGRAADYLTSPEVHTAFAGLICVQIVELWEALGRPDPFWLVEGGPGRGIFARDLLNAAEALFPSFAAALRVALVEASPVLRASQKALLVRWPDRIVWLDASPHGWRPMGVGIVVANELLDALPFHLVSGAHGGVVERLVGARDGRLVEVLASRMASAEGQAETGGSSQGAMLSRQIAEGGGHLEPGELGEVSLAAPAWVAAATGLIEQGYVLLLDYGEPATTLYGGRHPRGTLRCYWRHTTNEDPFARIGHQDVTAHVDLSAVTRAAEGAGAGIVGATSQEAFLGRLGVSDVLDVLSAASGSRAAEWRQRVAIESLIDQKGLGAVKVLLYAKSAPAHRVTGFGGASSLSSWGPKVGLWIAKQEGVD